MRASVIKSLLVILLIAPGFTLSTDKLITLPAGSVKISGYLGSKIDLCISERIKALDFDHFVEPFRHREETRLWQGEFFGKLMLAAISSYQYNNDPDMLAKISRAFKDLIATQTPDGYIGNYSSGAQLEQYNALLASLKGDGSQIAKYSPLEGTRSEGEKQCGMNINCCNANGPRGFMLLPQFSVMGGNNEITINLYSILSAKIPVNQKNAVSIDIKTGYPADEDIEVTINPEQNQVFAILLRIPAFSEKNELTVNGEKVSNIVPGTYQKISREWKKGDVIKLRLDLTARVMTLKGYQAITRGPVVLARDSRFRDRDVDEAAVISQKSGVVDLIKSEQKPDNIWMSFTAPVILGTNLEGEFRLPRQVHFCDFASAGNTWEEDSRYRVWIKRTVNVMKADYRGY